MSEENKNPEENSNPENNNPEQKKKGIVNKIKDKVKAKIKKKKKKKTSEKKKVFKKKRFEKGTNPDGKKNLNMKALKKAQSRMFELQQVNRDGLIAIIKKLEKW